MTIRITISDRVQFRVRGTITDDHGAAEAYEFRLTARRLSTAQLQAELADSTRRVEDFMAGLVTDWRGVVDAEGNDVPYSADALQQLFDRVPFLAGLCLKQYMAEVGAKEKN